MEFEIIFPPRSQRFFFIEEYYKGEKNGHCFNPDTYDCKSLRVDVDTDRVVVDNDPKGGVVGASNRCVESDSAS